MKVTDMTKIPAIAAIVLIAVFASASFAQSPLEDAGCTKVGADYACPQAALATDILATYLDDVECYSTGNATCTADCAGLVDIGCFAFLEINNNVPYRACDVVVNKTDISYNRNCQDAAISAGSNATAMLDPAIIDYSNCSKQFGDGIYIIHCPYFGRTQYLNASVVPEGLFVIDAADLQGFTISLEAAIILVLVAAIAFVSLWVLRPAKAGAAAGERRLRRRERRQ